MDWAALHAITEVVMAVAAAVATWSALAMRAALAELRTEIATARAEDKEELKLWINGSFMRTSLVTAELKALTIRMDSIEHAKGKH